MATAVEKTLSDEKWTTLGRGPLFINAPPTGAALALAVADGQIIAKSQSPRSSVVVSQAPISPDTVGMSEATGQAILAALTALIHSISSGGSTGGSNVDAVNAAALSLALDLGASMTI